MENYGNVSRVSGGESNVVLYMILFYYLFTNKWCVEFFFDCHAFMFLIYFKILSEIQSFTK